jgi:acetyl esterase
MALLRALPVWVLLLMTASERVNAASSAPRRWNDVEYSSADGLSLRFDACVPPGEGPFAAAILVHGGGWVRGDRRVEVAPLFQPLTDAGIAWFSVDYRLAPDPIQLGAAVPDVENAFRFIRAHAAEYRIDPDRIALVGESAGGQLAAMAALDDTAGLRVKAFVGLYAPFDLVSLANSAVVPESIRNAIHGTPWESMILGRLAQLSPIEHVRPGMPPFLLIHGTADALVPFDQSTKMCERMKAAGASCELFPVPGGGHGIRWWESNSERSGPYKRRLVEWLRARFGVRS